MKTFVAIGVAIVALIIGAGIGAAATSGGSFRSDGDKNNYPDGGQPRFSGEYAAQASTVTVTKTTSVVSTVTSLSAGTALVNYNGSGNANSPPFTATTSTIKVSMNVSSSAVSYSGVSWYVYPVGSQVYVAQGDVNAQTGQSSSFGYGLTPGQNYYVAVFSANANWQIVVLPMQ